MPNLRPLVMIVVGACLVSCSPPRATLLTELPDTRDVGPDAERYALSSDNTEVEAEISAAATFTLSFSLVEGMLQLDPNDPTRTQIALTIDTTTASSSIDRVAEIAMSDHFLDVAVHPTAAFANRTVERTDDDGLEMIAELDLHGVTRALRTPAKVEVAPCAVKVEVAFSFDRHAFGIQTEGSLEDVVSDTVAVIIRANVQRPCRAK